MLEKILRSPFMMMAMLIMIGIVFIGLRESWPFTLYYLPYIAVMVLYFILLTYHNLKFPNKKIRVFTIIPYELREDDEGLQYITFKAMRKVYIFYVFAIPVGILLITYFQPYVRNFAIGLLVVIGCIQYLLYWWEIRKAFMEEE